MPAGRSDLLSLRHEIDTIFEGRAFLRPLFYNYPGGLRFELAEGGSALEQFLLALSKARTVCSDIFSDQEAPVVVLRLHTGSNRFEHRAVLRALRQAGVRVPRTRRLWLEAIPAEEWFDEGCEEWWLHLAFEVPSGLLANLLWCAFASGAIHPQPACGVHLFNLAQRVMVLPYDDRGMDVVGPNHGFLSELYFKHHRFLLAYDLAAMAAHFEPPCAAAPDLVR